MLVALVLLLAAASPHQDALLEHPYDAATMEAPYVGDEADGGATRSTQTPQLNRIVYGYLPYWINLSGTTLRWDLMSHLAYFSFGIAPVTSEGTTTVQLDSESQSRLRAARYATVRDAAKANNVKFVLTMTNFSDTQIEKLVSTYKEQTIQLILDTVRNNGAEGVNVDFEFVPRSVKNEFVAFMRDLTTRMHAEIPGSHVTSATPFIDHAGAYDFDQLLIHSDGMMVMGYACHWKGSTVAGPNSPLTSGDIWYNCSVTRGINDYLQYGGVENRKGVIMGLPFYGFEWSTETLALKSKTTSSGRARTYENGKADLTRYYAWDSASQTPFASRLKNGTPTQMFLDDAESLDLKFALIVEKDIGGIGIWALGYEGKTTEFWDKIRNRFTAIPTPPVNQPPISNAGPYQTLDAPQVITLDGQASRDPEGEPLTFAWQQVSGPTVTLSDTTSAQPTFTPTQPGEYRFWLIVNDGVLNSAVSETQVTIGEPEPVPAQPNDPQTPVTPTQVQPETVPAPTSLNNSRAVGANGCQSVDASFAWMLVAATLCWRRFRT